MDVFQEAEMLRKVPFFGGLDSAKLKLLAFTSRALRVRPGRDPRAQRATSSDSAYVVLEGDVEIVGETSTGEFVIAVVGSNSLIGEMGVIQNVPRGRDRAREERRPGAAHFRGGLPATDHAKIPGCALDVMRQLSRRVAASNARLAAAQRELESLRGQLGKAPSAPVGGRAT